MLYTTIKNCRICRSAHLSPILNLGHQALTGIFPPAGNPDVESGPLELVKCDECHLVQLAHNYQLSSLYGDTYGYRSGLNQSMVRHLESKVKQICNQVDLKKGDVVLDIGSNDGTTLGAYSNSDVIYLGMDPSAAKFRKYYKPGIHLITDFFSAKNFKSFAGEKKAKVITSIAMFYDLEDPIGFATEIASILDPDGVWVFEQSYLPLMIDAMAYDTVCHEHLEYYGVHQIQRILTAAGLRIAEVETNLVNGGSFSITAVHNQAKRKSNDLAVSGFLQKEEKAGYLGLDIFHKFAEDVRRHREELNDTLHGLLRAGARIHGYGASTKGNVILQYCGLTQKEIPWIAEVNEEKFGHVTPGTRIPITSEAKSKEKNPTHFLVLPWHFRQSILEREKQFISTGGKLIFPLPKIEIVP